jgi:hypothetical protein
VLRLVAQGRSNKEIAVALTISERTVNTHLVHIFAKLDVSSRAAATAAALATKVSVCSKLIQMPMLLRWTAQRCSGWLRILL